MAGAGSVTTPVTAFVKLACLFFLTAEYYLEGEAGVNTVKVMIRVKVGGKYPYLPAVFNSNGRIKPGVALVGGVRRKVEGSYYLRFSAGGRRRWELIGTDAAAATTAARKMEATLKAKALGVTVKSPLLDAPPKRIKLTDGSPPSEL